MGNTKLIYFEGETDKPPTREELLKHAHGNDAAVDARPGGYLGEEKPGHYWVIGAVHSFSMDAYCLATFLRDRFFEVTVSFLDVDWSDCRLLYAKDHEFVEEVVYKPSLVPKPDIPS